MAARTRKRPTQTPAERLSARDCDVVGFLVAAFRANPSVELALQLLPYCAPRLRATEIKAEVAQQPIPDLSGVTPEQAARAYQELINGS